MPVGVVKTKAQEAAWSSAKKAAAKTKGKDVSGLSGDDWKLVQHIYQNATKSEMPDSAQAELKKAAGLPSLGKLMAAPKVPNPMKVGQQATVKIPKAKKPADPFGKPSLLLKQEIQPKHASIRKLREFLDRKGAKNKPRQS